jgi:hypothetical protein
MLLLYPTEVIHVSFQEHYTPQQLEHVFPEYTQRRHEKHFSYFPPLILEQFETKSLYFFRKRKGCKKWGRAEEIKEKANPLSSLFCVLA